jgi:gas vesicle protein
VFEAAEKQFREFLGGYKYGEDVDSIVSIIAGDHELTSRLFKLLELLTKKIARVREENFAEAEKLQKEIKDLQRQ